MWGIILCTSSNHVQHKSSGSALSGSSKRRRENQAVKLVEFENIMGKPTYWCFLWNFWLYFHFIFTPPLKMNMWFRTLLDYWWSCLKQLLFLKIHIYHRNHIDFFHLWGRKMAVLKLKTDFVFIFCVSSANYTIYRGVCVRETWSSQQVYNVADTGVSKQDYKIGRGGRSSKKEILQHSTLPNRPVGGKCGVVP